MSKNEYLQIPNKDHQKIENRLTVYAEALADIEDLTGPAKMSETFDTLMSRLKRIRLIIEKAQENAE